MIVISKILPDPVNTYLSRFEDTIVDQVNGAKVRTLDDLAKALQSQAPFHVIRVVDDPQPIVLETQAVAKADKRILKRYGISRAAYLQGGIVPDAWK